MTVLQALDRYYERLRRREEVAPYGFVNQQIGYALVLKLTGEFDSIVSFGTGKKNKTREFKVPAPSTEPKARTAGSIVPYFLWDKPSYFLGVEVPETNIRKKYAASRDFHMDFLSDATDDILVAVRRYFETYSSGLPEECVPTEFRDRPYVIRIVNSLTCAHETAEAQDIWAKRRPRSKAESAMCLITGTVAPIQRLHPKVNGFKDADTLVGFDKDAFTSYGKEQGANAPTSEAAAFRYGEALNRMLDRGSRNRLSRQVGDATVAFWADTSATVDEPAAEAAEAVFFEVFEAAPADDDPQEAAKLRDSLEKVAQGRPQEARPAMRPGTRFHVLGLAPNAARLSVRYWLDDSFEAFAQRLLDHERDLRLDPAPKGWGAAKPPTIQRLLLMTLVPDAIRRKGLFSKSSIEFLEKNHSLVAGEIARAVLGGTPYPRNWLAAALIRLRAGDDPSIGWHAAAIRAVLERGRRLNARNQGKSDDVKRRPEVPMSLDRSHPNSGYQLGRLFAIYELAQIAALGRNIKSTIRDKYFGAASASPASIFPLIITNGQNHLSKVRKEKPGWAYLIEKELEEVIGRFTPQMPHSIPRSLRLEDQGEFAIGYYHQRKAKLGDSNADQPTLELNGEESADDE